jgi:hypothetical protein
MVRFINSTSVEEMNNIFDKIILVKPQDKPTEEQINEFKDILYRYSKTDTWEEALKHFDCADLRPYKKSLRYMINQENIIKKSDICRWAYILNLDTNELEIYEGLQTIPEDNRYKINKKSIYCNCRLFKSIPFRELNFELVEEIQKEYDKKVRAI